MLTQDLEVFRTHCANPMATTGVAFALVIGFVMGLVAMIYWNDRAQLTPLGTLPQR
jgi:hypothetical protein